MDSDCYFIVLQNVMSFVKKKRERKRIRTHLHVKI